MLDRLKHGRNKNDEIVSLFNDEYDRLLGIGSGLCHDRQLIEDCIQDLFLKFCQNRELILNANNPQSYLTVSLRREVLRKLKAKTEEEYDSSKLIDLSVPSYEDLLIKSQTTIQSSIQIKKAFKVLSKSEKTILTMRFYRSMSYDEIANRLGVSKRTVYNQIHTSIKKIRSFY
ncbi:MAG: sigma-70 family RNA polymerase sigma factor [Saprospiraceae bacterium]|nr:sigma-70 family RNA polymerase sigma factor [Saprospiraceae bacterium]